MGLREAILGNGNGHDPEIREMAEQLRGERATSGLLQENLRLLEIAMEDEGWRRSGWRMKREFTRWGLDKIIELSRSYYLSHPLIQRAVNVTTYYTWAQGATFQAEDERVQKEILEPMMADDGNINEIYGHQARLLTDVDQLVDGNVFLVLHTDLDGAVQIRSVPAEEIREIHTKSGDNRVIWFYRRVWQEVVFNITNGQIEQRWNEKLYPDWRYHPKNQPDSIGGVEVMWGSPIIHQKSGGLKSMLFGVPETYSALDWARAYRKFLENWHTLVASLAKFAWKVTTKGSKIKSASEKLQSTIPGNDESREEHDFTSGGAFVGKPGDDISPIPKTGASTSAEDARPSRLMVAASMNIPDTILSGDVDVGNFATSKTLDRPTELYMRSRQTMWNAFHQDILRYRIDAGVRCGALPGKILWDTDGDSKVESGLDPTMSVTFPPILEDDPLAVVQAIVAAATLEGKAEAGTVPRDEVAKLLMEAIGVDNIEDALNELSEADKQELEETVERMAQEIKKMAEAAA